MGPVDPINQTLSAMQFDAFHDALTIRPVFTPRENDRSSDALEPP
jgi:hypothetical protein